MSLRTDRLDLQQATMLDVDRMMMLDADPAVMRYINGGRPSTRSEIEDRLRVTDGSLYLATERATTTFVGWFSIRHSSDGERELGYRLRRQWWRRGLATEGARAMIDLAFADPNVQRVWAQTMTVNVGSRAVIERCGLRYVRTFFDEWPEGPIEGSELGDVEYELSRPEWVKGLRSSAGS